jgi:hypothetical protein
MADDGSQVVFWGSPNGADSVEVTWLRREKRVPPGEATHARITEWGGSAPGERIVSGSVAYEYVKQLQAGDYREPQRSLELTSACPHCDIPRAYSGVELLGTVDMHVYQCVQCGSVELFRDGPIGHPLSGNADR